MEHTFNMDLYKKLQGFVSKHALVHIIEEFDCIHFVQVFSNVCCHLLHPYSQLIYYIACL